MPEKDTYTIEGVELRKDIQDMCVRIYEAMRFYMELHGGEKGGHWKNQSIEHNIEGILRNFHEFYKAYRAGDEREMLAEGIGVINYMAVLLDVYVDKELDAIQDWKPILGEIRKRDGDSRTSNPILPA